MSAIAKARNQPTLGAPLRDSFGSAVVDLASDDPRILLLDADVGNSTRADLFDQAHPDRYLPMGIAEQNMMGVAAGLAAVGFVPFATTFAVFAAKRALDQIRVLIAQTRLPVKIAVGYTGLLTGMTGRTHQVVEDVTIMRAMPNMVVINPADEIEMRQAVWAAVEHDGPVYLRVYRERTINVFDTNYRFRLGAAQTLRYGTDISLISTGPQTGRVLVAADILAAQGIDARVVHVPTIKPLDQTAIIDAANATGLVVTIEEHSVIGGLGGAVAEVLSEYRPTRVVRLGLQDVFGESGPNDALLEKYGLTPQRVADQVARILTRNGPPAPKQAILQAREVDV
ncbi:MAG: transketolase C-terminal domain-containing protein [Candidatus Dormiibacterota bacterium]